MSRLDRLNSFLKREIADILLKKVNDKRIGMISILEVKLSKDQGHAWVYYSQIGDEDARYQTKKGLQAATPFVRLEVGKVLQTKTVPQIHFKYDDGIEKATEILKKIQDLSLE